MRFLAVAALAAGLMFAGAANAQDKKEEGRERFRAMREEALKKYDENKDGKLDEKERAKQQEDFIAKLKGGEVPAFLLTRYDADKDGKLSDEEKTKMIDAVKSGRGAGGRGGPGGRGGEEFQKRLLERFDANKDGKLDAAEQAEADKARESRRGRPDAKKKAE